ncbi:YfiR family protein [Marinilabiliaceae bacterium ANBcel2]|nr:YfiR family protein [Marinilabiliaceae bacterium ANBcel2]
MRKLTLLLTVVLLITFSDKSKAQIEEHQATFVYNFTRLVQWPDLHTEEAFVIGVYGSREGITQALESTAGERNVAGLSIRIEEYSSADEIEHCHILFVSNRGLRDISEVTNAIGGEPVLIVTENQGRHPSGSMINLSVINDRLGLHLDSDLAEGNGLVISSQLANFAR